MKLLIAGAPDFAHISLAEFGKYLVFATRGAGHPDIISRRTPDSDRARVR